MMTISRASGTSESPAHGNDTEHTVEPSSWRRVGSLQTVWVTGVLITICVFFSLMAGSKFLSTGNFSLISQNIAVLAVLGVGMTFVIITAGIDLSIGSVLVFSSVIAAKVMEYVGSSDWMSVTLGATAALGSGAAWGTLNGFLIAKRKLPPLVVTLGTLSVALGLAQVITDGIDIRSVPTPMTDFATYVSIAGLPSLTFVALVVVVGGGVALHKTRYGRYTYAIGSNPVASERVGVKTERHLMWVYGLSGTLAGLGALMTLAQFGTTTISGQALTNLNVIAAVVIGGTSIFGGEGSIFGTMVGLSISAVLQAGFVIVGLQPFWQAVALGTVLVSAVYLDQSRRAAAQRGRVRPRSPLVLQRIAIRRR